MLRTNVIRIGFMPNLISLLCFYLVTAPFCFGLDKDEVLDRIVDKHTESRERIHSGRLEASWIIFWEDNHVSNRKLTAVFTQRNYTSKYTGVRQPFIISATDSGINVRVMNETTTNESMYFSHDETRAFRCDSDGPLLQIWDVDYLRNWLGYYCYSGFGDGYWASKRIPLTEYIQKKRAEIEVADEGGLFVLSEGDCRYWIDPQRGYLIVKYEFVYSPTHREIITVDVKDYGNGVWYPAKIHDVNTNVKPGGGSVQKTESWIEIQKFTPNGRVTDRDFGLEGILHSKIKGIQDNRYEKRLSYDIDWERFTTQSLDEIEKSNPLPDR